MSDKQEKSHLTVASSPDEAGGNQLQAEPEQLTGYQLSEVEHNITEEKTLKNDVNEQPVGVYIFLTLMKIIKRHIACDEQITFTVALWIMMTWCFEAFKVLPIACIVAQVKGAGKTQLLTLMRYLSYKASQTSNISLAALFRQIDRDKPSLFIDEADTFLKQNIEIVGALNAGFEVNGTVIRCVGDDHEPTEFNVFCPKAIAGIGHLPDTLKDRSILLHMRPKRPDETLTRLRHADMQKIESVRAELARWAKENFNHLSNARPELPDAISDRAQDCWEPLLAIADLLGADYGDRAREIALHISGSKDNACERMQLLADIKHILEAQQLEKVFLKDLLHYLCLDPEAVWSTLNHGRSMSTHQLAKILGEFDVKTTQIRIGKESQKGYLTLDFETCFNDYLR